MIAIAGMMALLLALQLATQAWWWIAVVPLLYGMLRGRSAWESARSGALAAGLLWTGASGYALIMDADLVAARVAAVLHLPWSWLLVLAGGLAAALVAGLAASAGFYLRAAARPRTQRAGAPDARRSA